MDNKPITGANMFDFEAPLPLPTRLKLATFTLGCLTVFGGVVAAIASAQVQPPAAETQCNILGAANVPANQQQIRLYTGPNFDATDGSYGLPGDQVEMVAYQNNVAAGEEWYQVRFPETDYVGWVIAYHIACPNPARP